MSGLLISPSLAPAGGSSPAANGLPLSPYSPIMRVMPKHTPIKIRSCKKPGYPWCVVIPPHLAEAGQRGRRYCKNKQEAQGVVDELKNLQAEFGGRLAAMPEDLRIMATECAERLAVFSATLRDATNFYIEHRRRTDKSVSVENLVAEVIAKKKALGASERYLGDLEHRLGKFKLEFGPRIVSDLTSIEIEKWIDGFKYEPVGRNNLLRVVGVAMSFAAAREYLAVNPTKKIAKAKEPSEEIAAFTAAESEDVYWTLARFFVLRGAVNLLVFRNRSKWEDWEAHAEETARRLIRAECQGEEAIAALCRNSLEQAAPRARLWMEAAVSWAQLCNSSLSSEALEAWLEIAERQEG
jgi:hypothetical protein